MASKHTSKVLPAKQGSPPQPIRIVSIWLGEWPKKPSTYYNQLGCQKPFTQKLWYVVPFVIDHLPWSAYSKNNKVCQQKHKRTAMHRLISSASSPPLSDFKTQSNHSWSKYLKYVKGRCLTSRYKTSTKRYTSPNASTNVTDSITATHSLNILSRKIGSACNKLYKSQGKIVKALSHHKGNLLSLH